MCEILVKAVDAAHSEPVKDQRGCYKSGGIVAVMPDGHEWGKEECLPKFYVFRLILTLQSLEQAKKYIEPETTLVYEDGELQKKRITRNRWKFDFAQKFSPEQLDEISKSDWLLREITDTDIEDKVA